jgi:hypothetical protein
MNILNSNEAFAAMMAGRKIMCRAIGELIEFDDIDQFPATIYAKPGYEFCIKIETMELAGITFTKPLTLDDVREGQDVYTVNTYGPSIYISEFGKMTCTALIESINSGFAQCNAENAKLQLQAMCKALGRELTGDCLVVRLGTEDKPKKRRSRKTEDPAANDQNSASNDVEEKTFEIQSNIQITEQGPVTAAEDCLTEEFVETDAVKLVEKFTAQIAQFTNAQDVLSFRHVFLANGHLDQKDQQHLCKLTEDKLLELDPEQYTPKVEPIVNEIIEAQQSSLIDEIDHEATKAVQHTMYKDAMSGNSQSSYPIDMLYTKKKEMLINRIQEMDSVEALERLAPAIPAAKFNPEDHQELLQIYAERKTAMKHADRNSEAS